MKVDSLFDNYTSKKEFINKHCGKLMGGGCFRDVYELVSFPKLVAKIERVQGDGMFANVTEFRNYVNNQHWDKLSEWLAPCRGITIDGLILIQDKVKFKPREQYPSKIPSVFTDTKYDNFGWIGNNFVCCDYAFMVMTSLRMKNVKWRR